MAGLAGGTSTTLAQGGGTAAPTVRVIDAETGAPLKGNVFGGSWCAKYDGDPAFTCAKLSDYSWSRMLDTSMTTGLNEVYMEGTGATRCAESTQHFLLRNIRAPKGYGRIYGTMKLCKTGGPWVVATNTTGGSIVYNKARNEVIFKFRKIAAPATIAPPSSVATSGGRLPATGAVTGGTAGVATLLVGLGLATAWLARRPRAS